MENGPLILSLESGILHCYPRKKSGKNQPVFPGSDIQVGAMYIQEFLALPKCHVGNLSVHSSPKIFWRDLSIAVGPSQKKVIS